MRNTSCVDVCSIYVVYTLRPLNPMDLIMVLGMCVCRSFLVSLCMFTVLKALLMSRAILIVRAVGAF